MKNWRNDTAKNKFVTSVLSHAAEIYPQYMVDIQDVMKNNGTLLTGIVIKEPQNNTAPVIYIDDYYEMWKEGTSLSEILNSIRLTYEKHRVINSIDTDFIFNYQSVKPNLTCRLVNTEQNRELLQKIPHFKFMDLSGIFYVTQEIKELKETADILIRNSHFRVWNISLEELKKTAIENTKRLQPARIECLDNYMYVITNNTMTNGASTVLYDDTLEKVKERTNWEHFYLIPSSIHEWLVVQEQEINRKKMEEIIKDINASLLQENEVLSDHIYRYSNERGLENLEQKRQREYEK